MKKVLFVDDSEETRELIEMIFIGSEMQLDLASNSQEAIRLMNINNYNACILDVSLPDLTGYYLGKLIRQSCENMPIAFLTNYEGNLTKENAEFINAEFWAKGDVFKNPLQLIGMIENIASEESCSSAGKIQMPDIIRQLA